MHPNLEIKVWVHQGSVLSPLLFNIVLQAIAHNFKKGLPWELLYADDLVLLAESRVELERRIMEWIARLKDKGLQLNMGKTKVMNCKMGIGTWRTLANSRVKFAEKGWLR